MPGSKQYKHNWYVKNKNRANVNGWLRMINSKKIQCGCGCGQMIYPIDKRGRSVKRLQAHTHIGIKMSEETKRKIGLANKRIASPKEIKRLRTMAEKRRGIPLTREHKKKVSVGIKNTLKKLNRHWNTGRTGIFDKEELERRRKSFSGENNPRWNGGNWINSYSKNFNNTFKRMIYNRDGGCIVCKAKDRPHIHHINRDPFNTCKENCLTLCVKCHNRVHASNIFNKTIPIFREFLKNKYGYSYQEVRIFQ